MVSLLILNLSFLSVSVHANKYDSLFERSTMLNAKISPDGEHLAVHAYHDDEMILMFLDHATMKTVGIAKFEGPYEVGDFTWVNNERVVINMVKQTPGQEAPVYYGELFAINYDGSRGEVIYGIQASSRIKGSHIKKKERTVGWGEVVDVLPEDDLHILIKSTPMDKTGEKLPYLYKLNVYTGVFKKKVARAPVAFANFVTDIEGDVRAVAGVNGKGEHELHVRKDGKWIEIDQSLFGNVINPLSVSSSGKYLYTADNYEQDLTGVFKLDLDDFSYTEVFTDRKVDITNISMSTDGRSAYGIRVDENYPSYLILDKKNKEAEIFKMFLQTFPYSKVTITSKTENESYYVVLVSSDVNPGVVYLYNTVKNSLKELFKVSPKARVHKLRETEPVEFTSSDGLSVHGYFTKGVTEKETDIAPLVILVHGGPHGVRDYWSFDPEIQYLALNGYSVLQVNYRGSGGYGKSFEESGYKTWGSDIQRDIYEAYQYLITQKKAKKGNACIMGASFGGYSAIQSAVLYPDTYNCAVANAGIYDLELMFEEGDVQERDSGISYLEKVLGTNENVLKKMSPVHHVDKIQIPLFLAHGEEDERAPVEHVERLKDALDKKNKDYKWFVLDKEGHGFFNPENRKNYMGGVKEFLDEHLM